MPDDTGTAHDSALQSSVLAHCPSEAQVMVKLRVGVLGGVVKHTQGYVLPQLEDPVDQYRPELLHEQPRGLELRFWASLSVLPSVAAADTQSSLRVISV
jgi:hypothetical protein